MIYTSKVIKGHGRGKQIGFPTFNLVIPKRFNKKFGVYVARVKIHKRSYLGALHFGYIPTFGLEDPSLEVYVLDYQNNEEIDELDFEIIKYIRPIRKFASVEELKKQIELDVQAVRSINKP